MKKVLMLPAFLLLFQPASIFAQCSCNSTPLLGSLELPATSAGSWQFAVTYDYNNVTDSYVGTKQIDLVPEFKTHSGLFEVSYGLTPRFSVSTLISFVQQNRNTPSSLTRTRGFGDAAVLLKYSVIQMTAAGQRSAAIGAGPKIPLGKSKLRNKNGILYSESLQPGTGAWDLILWGYAFQGFQPVTPANLFATASYRINGKNWRNFEYGNELSLTVGSSYITTTPFDFSLLLRYRTIGEHTINGNTEPNTGGTWFSVMPGINVKVSNALSFRVSGEIPLYRNLKGAQLTTTYTTSVSLFYTIAKKPALQILK